MNKQRRWMDFGFVVAAMLGIVVFQEAWARSQIASIPYSQFQQLVREDKVAQVVVSQDQVQGELKEPLDGGKKRFVTVRVDADMAKELQGHGVQFAGRLQNDLLPTILSFILPPLIFFGIWIWLSRRMAKQMGGMGGGLMSIGKSKAKVYVETDTKTSFADVAGVEEAKAELQEVVAFLKDPAAQGRLGARAPKGVLLVGPPGTGKTLLAKAVAGEASVPFFSISGSEFVEMFVGVGAARVRDLFTQARAKAPAIIFIDELDALGRARASVAGMGGHDEKEQTLNQLLVELDGFDPAAGIVLLGATNRPEVLDPALLRAGRFDRQVLVDRPDRGGRVAILAVHSRKVKLAPGVKLEEVAALTPGFTGADLANLVNEAALVATRRGAEEISLEDFNVAVERIVAGLEKKNRVLNPREREVVAHHELGHALVAAALPGNDPVHKISIIPRGIGALGYTIQRPTEDRFLMTREELEDKMAVLLGGRAAEHLVYGHLSTGAANDLEKASEIARSMVTRYGMGGRLGAVSYQSEPDGFLGQLGGGRRLYSEETAREIDLAVRELVDGAFRRARVILQGNRALLDEGAKVLLAQETLSGEALETLLARVRREAARSAA